MALHQRLLQDIAELQRSPYPNIAFCVSDSLQKGCLLLTPNGKKPLHLTIIFGENYPLKAPIVTIQSRVQHPNVFNDYICASILNTAEGYTPAYTLKSISIQLLSFFSSERIEQTGGWSSIALDGYRGSNSCRDDSENEHKCLDCGFGGWKTNDTGFVIVGGKTIPDPFAQRHSDDKSVQPSTPGSITGRKGGKRFAALANLGGRIGNMKKRTAPKVHHGEEKDQQERSKEEPHLVDRILNLPDEIILLILGGLDTGDLLAVSKVDNRIEGFVNSYNTIRMRELQCFCFKKSFMETKLGVGVRIAREGRKGAIESEFDLLSQVAFEQFKIRQSVQGLPFEQWLPLPLAHRHWRSVRADVHISLVKLARAAAIEDSRNHNVEVIYNFMNNIVVKLNEEAKQGWGPQSTLTHASEKAVEAYFSIFHLLLCLATEHDRIIPDVNRRLESFLAGQTLKETCPNLGFLLVAALVSDKGLTQELTLAIIKEAILRNVVWMLSGGKNGKRMAELNYIEPSAVSEYRLDKTFESGIISYRLLMFQALFYRTARSNPHKSTSAIRDELFQRHGAPPKGAAEKMAAEIKEIQTVKTWPVFFRMMGLENSPSKEISSKENFCAFLKRTIGDSVKVGYSRQALSQEKALALRRTLESEVEVAKGVVASTIVPDKYTLNFFPGKTGKGKGR